ncbi:MAG: 2-phospho-L-lactate transferase [Anaerolineales bacterium]|nr:MAG: 2-phospho-L-lactate transferase [Anaerolineales bacterium]
MDLKVVALAGGVGGAKLADGLAACLKPQDLTIVVNTADDFTHLGLQISPDLDTVTYTLAGLAHPEHGWGRADESWNFLETLGVLGGPTWFRLGDRDLALHHARTQRRERGESLSAITQDMCERLGIGPTILPMSDNPVRTIVTTDEGELPFQEYFVARNCEPIVKGFRFEGVEEAQPAPGVLQRLESADLVILCPSNPWVSLDPILAIPGIRPAVIRKPVFMISPIIAGASVKGPAAKMFSEFGIEPSALAVAQHYADLLDGILMDAQDAHMAPAIEALGVRVAIDQTWMRTRADRNRLAQSLLQFSSSIHLKESIQ